MTALKYIRQILSALIYTPIYTGIMYFVIVLPAIWILSLSFWKMILLLIILGGIVEGIISLLQTFGLLPYTWIVKDNRVSLWISIVLCVIFPLLNIYSLWKHLYGQGTWGIVAAVILSFLLLQFVYGSVLALLELSIDEE